MIQLSIYTPRLNGFFSFFIGDCYAQSIERWSRRTFGISEICVLLWDLRGGINCYQLRADTTESLLESILHRQNYSWIFFLVFSQSFFFFILRCTSEEQCRVFLHRELEKFCLFPEFASARILKIERGKSLNKLLGFQLRVEGDIFFFSKHYKKRHKIQF